MATLAASDGGSGGVDGSISAVLALGRGSRPSDIGRVLGTGLDTAMEPNEKPTTLIY